LSRVDEVAGLTGLLAERGFTVEELAHTGSSRVLRATTGV
jgi:hypothetical protein